MPELIVHWLAAALYLLSGIFFVHGLSSEKPKSLPTACRLALFGLLFHTVSLVLQWYARGHGPYLRLDESLSALAWGAMGMFLLFNHKAIWQKSFGVILAPCAFLLMLVRIFATSEPGSPPATFTGIWFIMHVISIIPAMGAFLIALSAAILYLLKKRGQGGFRSRLPSLEVLDACVYKYAGFAFILWGFMIIAGAFWAEQSWGRYWGWDTIETWSFITWLLLGLLLHLQRFFNWQGERAAWAMMACFVVSILTLFLLPLVLGSIHADYLIL
ncbi:MAG: cytochrome c biogenesis protein CcsA [Desulfobulbaceae bacterium]|nr:cytochrome c biogenesis protein CcsA [Desulfobulbaceae bacterium]